MTKMVLMFSVVTFIIILLFIATIVYFWIVSKRVERYTNAPIKGIMSTQALGPLASVILGLKPKLRNMDFNRYSLDGNQFMIMTGRSGGTSGSMFNRGNTTNIIVEDELSQEVNYQLTTLQRLTLRGKNVEYMSIGYEAPLLLLVKCNVRAKLGIQKTGALGFTTSAKQETDRVMVGEYHSNFRVFAWRRVVYDADAPSVCDLYFAIGDNTSEFNSDMEMQGSQNAKDGFSKFSMDVSNVMMGNMLLSRPNGVRVEVEDCRRILIDMCRELYGRFYTIQGGDSVDNSLKCKDCLISLMMQKKMDFTKATQEVDKMMKVRPDEYLQIMGQNPSQLSDELRGQLPAMELNEVIGQLNKHIEINEFGEKVHMTNCILPLSFIQRMMNDSPQSVRFDNMVPDKVVKYLVLDNLSIETNIPKTLPNEVSRLMNEFDPEKYGNKDFGAFIYTGNNSDIRRVLIKLFALSDSVTMRRINELLNTFGVTLRERKYAKEEEKTSSDNLNVATRDNVVAQAGATASQNALNEQVPKTQAKQQLENQQAGRYHGTHWRWNDLRWQGYESRRGGIR